MYILFIFHQKTRETHEWQFCVNAGIHKFLSCCDSGGSMALQETIFREGFLALPFWDKNIVTGMNLIFT
jgi:hypothetical protein